MKNYYLNYYQYVYELFYTVVENPKELKKKKFEERESLEYSCYALSDFLYYR